MLNGEMFKVVVATAVMVAESVAFNVTKWEPGASPAL
jgi:hypothetical protein